VGLSTSLEEGKKGAKEWGRKLKGISSFFGQRGWVSGTGAWFWGGLQTNWQVARGYG